MIEVVGIDTIFANAIQKLQHASQLLFVMHARSDFTNAEASPLLIIANAPSATEAVSWIDQGARAYVVASGLADLDRIREAIDHVEGGHIWIDPLVADVFIERAIHPDFTASFDPDAYKLNERDIVLLGWLQTSKTNREIAEAMNLSYATIKKYNSALYAKLCVGSRVAAVALARQGHDTAEHAT